MPKSRTPKTSAKPAPSSVQSPTPQDLQQLVAILTRYLQDLPARPEQVAEEAGWLDWGLNLLGEYGPKLLEMAPALLALL